MNGNKNIVVSPTKYNETATKCIKISHYVI